MRLLLFLLVSLCVFTQAASVKAETKWMLLGIVLQKESQRPIENIKVCLEMKTSEERTCFTTLTDGCFYFSLEKDQQYWVHIVDESEKVVTSKEVSTLGKEEPEVMHLLLEY